MRANLKGVQKRQKRLYDTKLSHTSFQKGDLVYKIDNSTKIGHSKKLRPIFMGPYLVQEVLALALFRLEGRKKTIVAHHDKLIKCRDRQLPFWIRRKHHQLMGTGREQDLTVEEVEEMESEEVEQKKRKGEGEENEEVDEETEIENEVGETEVVEEVDEETQQTEVMDIEENDGMEEERGFVGDLGVKELFHTRGGRAVKQPSYLKEYVV